MLNVLMIAAENAALPGGKVGGIGDVIRDIPQFLARQQVNVSVLTPGYRHHSVANPSTLVCRFDVPFQSRLETVELFELQVPGETNVKQWVVEHDIFANAGTGKIYCDDGPNRPFASDASKFAFFGAVVCELLTTDWRGHFKIVHLHDWHAAFVAILRAFDPRYAALKACKLVYTIHNLAIQGTRPLRGDPSSFETWFPTLKYDAEQLVDPRYPDCINPARAGILLSDVVHAVSPSYAKEILQESNPKLGTVGGEGLEKDLQKIASENRLFGILNGCDYSQYDKVKRPRAKAETTVGSSTTAHTQRVKELLEHAKTSLMQLMAKQRYMQGSHYIALEHLRHWQSQPQSTFTGPLVTSVGRLTEQKVKLLLLPHGTGKVIDHLLNRLAEDHGLLIVVGSGDPAIELTITQVMSKHPNLLFVNGYCDGLPEHLYQQGDLFLMPSSMEPCGISQMLAMREGQPCLVHATGGLKDTVKHLKNGFSFAGENDKQRIDALIDTFEQALKLFKEDQKRWNTIAQSAAKQRFLWQESAKHYIDQLYS